MEKEEMRQQDKIKLDLCEVFTLIQKVQKLRDNLKRRDAPGRKYQL